MVVEDENIVALDIKHTLKQLGYSVPAIVSTGEEAIKKTEKHQPDLVMMDIRLKGKMGGIEAAKQIKEQFNIPVVYLTAYADKLTLQQAKISEPYGYIIKPFEEKDLHSNIEIALYKHKMEMKLQESEERLKTIISSMDDLVFILDQDGVFIDYYQPSDNPRLYVPPENIIGKSYMKALPSNVSSHMELAINTIKATGTSQEFDYSLTISGRETWYNAKVSIRKNIHGKFTGITVVARNITERKRAEREMKRRLMRYDLEDGNIYLVKESTLTESVEAFKDLLKVGYDGVIISRTPEKQFKRNIEQEYYHVWLSENGKESSIPPILKNIEDFIDELPRHNAVLFDGLDYIKSKIGVKKTISLVQSLRERAYLYDHVIIISVDPTSFSNKVTLLEKETTDIKPMITAMIREDLLEVLRLVYEKNIIGIKPTYSKINQELKVSKPTIRKRIRRLVSDGLLFENAKGRTKVVELTEKGRALFQK